MANTAIDFRAEQRKVDLDIAAAKAALQDALRCGAETGTLRADLRSAEERRADIDQRLNRLAETIAAAADLKARKFAAQLAADIRAGLDAKLAALQAPPKPTHA